MPARPPRTASRLLLLVFSVASAVAVGGSACSADGSLSGIDKTCENGLGACPDTDGFVDTTVDTSAPDDAVPEVGPPEVDTPDVSPEVIPDIAPDDTDGADVTSDASEDGADVLDGECESGRSSLCFSTVGECKVGKRFCIDGAWGECVGGRGPTEERCDGLDNDCDGTDDNRELPCECSDGEVASCGTTDIGACELGSRLCVDGAWADCQGNVEPGSRLCDNQDRDCNGADDWTQSPCECRDGQTRSCGNSNGICREGTETCASGAWGPCLGGTGPLTLDPSEGAVGLCNGVDDNCDGQVDEGCGCTPPETQPCGTDVGNCSIGVQSCLLNGTWGGCVGGVLPTGRQCDAQDRDCDGSADWTQPPCQCINGQTRSCGSAVGECRIGSETCTNGAWGTCVGGQVAQAERCDGLDNDCDGLTDEGLSAPTSVACWEPSPTGRICGDPNSAVVPPLVYVQLDGLSSSDPDGQSLSYQWRIDAAPDGSTTTIGNPTSPRPTLFAQLAGTYRVCLTVTDTSLCASAESCVSVRVVPSSRIHIQLTWDKDNADMDLHFMLSTISNFFHWGPGRNPNCPKANDCFWVCDSPEWGVAGPADNPRLDIDNVSGFGPENINLDSPFSGTFPIVVHMWCDRAAGADNLYAGAPTGAATATVRLYVDGVVVQTWERSLTRRDLWHVADLVWSTTANPPWSLTARNAVTKLAAPGCSDP